MCDPVARADAEALMGIDFLELTFRLEKRFGIELRIGVWEDVVRRQLGRKFDITAGEVSDVVTAQLNAQRGGKGSARDVTLRPGPVLEYRSTAGDRAGYEGDPWPAVRDVIAASLSVPADKITPESWLRRDLGME
jgi:acyl carrier protein